MKTSPGILEAARKSARSKSAAATSAAHATSSSTSSTSASSASSARSAISSISSTGTGTRSCAVALAVDQPFRAIIRVFGMVRRVMEPYFAKFGVSGPQWGVLRALHRAEDEGASSVPMTDLSNRLLIRPPSVTTIVAQLVRMGLIKRHTSSDDGRVKEVSLSLSGRRLVARVLANHQTQINYIMAGLDDRERQELGRLLGRLAEHLEAMVDQPSPFAKTNGRKARGSAVAKQRKARS